MYSINFLQLMIHSMNLCIERLESQTRPGLASEERVLSQILIEAPPGIRPPQTPPTPRFTAMLYL